MHWRRLCCCTLPFVATASAPTASTVGTITKLACPSFERGRSSPGRCPPRRADAPASAGRVAAAERSAASTFSSSASTSLREPSARSAHALRRGLAAGWEGSADRGARCRRRLRSCSGERGRGGRGGRAGAAPPPGGDETASLPSAPSPPASPVPSPAAGDAAFVEEMVPPGDCESTRCHTQALACMRRHRNEVEANLRSLQTRSRALERALAIVTRMAAHRVLAARGEVLSV